MSLTHLNPAAQTTLAQWHQMLLAGDLSGLPALLHPDGEISLAHGAYALPRRNDGQSDLEYGLESLQRLHLSNT